MNVEPHHTLDQLKMLYRTEMNARPAPRIQGVYLAKMGRTRPEIMRITGAAGRTVQQWLAAIDAWQKAALDPILIQSVCRAPYAERIN